MNKFMTWQTEHSCNLVINFTLLCLITTLAVGCKNNSSTSNTSQSAIVPTTNPATAIQPLRVVTVPTESSTYKKKNLQELGDYLQKIIQRPVSFEVAKNYEAAVDLIVKEDVYMAYLGPLTYIKSHQLNPHIEPLVLAIDKDTGRPWYTSVIVANTKKGIKSLSDLKGKRFTFVSPSSTSGFLLPMSAFQKHHIDPTKDFTHIRYSGSHDKAEADLTSDTVDAIADNKSTFLQSQAARKFSADQYKIIWESDPIPSSPIVINKNKFSPEIIKKLQKALIDAPPGLVHIDGGESAGYTLAKDADFEGIREVYFKFISVKIATK